jgi:hypothetical protein
VESQIVLKAAVGAFRPDAPKANRSGHSARPIALAPCTMHAALAAVAAAGVAPPVPSLTSSMNSELLAALREALGV